MSIAAMTIPVNPCGPSNRKRTWSFDARASGAATSPWISGCKDSMRFCDRLKGQSRYNRTRKRSRSAPGRFPGPRERAGQIQPRRWPLDADAPTANSPGWLASCVSLGLKRPRATLFISDGASLAKAKSRLHGTPHDARGRNFVPKRDLTGYYKVIRNCLCNGTTVCQGPCRPISHRSMERGIAFSSQCD